MAVRIVLLLCLSLSVLSLSAQPEYSKLMDITGEASEDAYARMIFVRPEMKSERKVQNITDDFYVWLDTARLAPFVSYNVQAAEIVEALMLKRQKELVYMTAVLRFHDPVIKNMLRKEKLSESWKYLPLVLSAGVTSSSWSGGAGPWHLYYPHARKQGLIVSPRVDERLDFEKSAAAAIGVISEMRKKGKADSLALIEYACGPAYASVRDSSLLSWCSSLPAQMLAMDYIYSNRERLGLASKNAVPVPVEREVVKKEVEIPVTAKVLEMDEKKLFAINETILTGVVPQNYSINLPAKMQDKFVQLEDSIYSATAITIQPVFESPKVVVYVVRSGDTLSEIAQKYGVSLSRLRYANKMRGDMIYAGQKLIIPND